MVRMCILRCVYGADVYFEVCVVDVHVYMYVHVDASARVIHFIGQNSAILNKLQPNQLTVHRNI